MNTLPDDFFDRHPELRGLDPEHVTELLEALEARRIVEECFAAEDVPEDPADRELFDRVREALFAKTHEAEPSAVPEDAQSSIGEESHPWDAPSGELELVGACASGELDWFAPMHLGVDSSMGVGDVEPLAPWNLSLSLGRRAEACWIRIEGFPRAFDGSRVRVVQVRADRESAEKVTLAGRVHEGACLMTYGVAFDPPLLPGDRFQVTCQSRVPSARGSSFHWRFAAGGGDRDPS
ncbi:MAG: hypothetical protein H6834_17255 [Planctomycetes bacterium]|nr:hypothetical protein [Planctomycetota bacterium]